MCIALSVDRYVHPLYSATKVSLPLDTQGLLSRELLCGSHTEHDDTQGRLKCDLGNKSMS